MLAFGMVPPDNDEMFKVVGGGEEFFIAVENVSFQAPVSIKERQQAYNAALHSDDDAAEEDAELLANKTEINDSTGLTEMFHNAGLTINPDLQREVLSVSKSLYVNPKVPQVQSFVSIDEAEKHG
jgi:hypothetical protein